MLWRFQRRAGGSPGPIAKPFARARRRGTLANMKKTQKGSGIHSDMDSGAFCCQSAQTPQGLKVSMPRSSSPSRTSLAVVYIIRVSTAPER